MVWIGFLLVLEQETILTMAMVIMTIFHFPLKRMRKPILNLIILTLQILWIPTLDQHLNFLMLLIAK